jgi:hypothetical protein
MSRKNLYIFCLLFGVFFLSSCSQLILTAYGIKQTGTYQNQEIEKLCKKYNVPANACYTLDTAYLGFLFQQDSLYTKDQINNHLQALQVLYFNENGQLTSYHVNCYAGGFPNLNWNRTGAFNTFTPTTTCPVDSIVSLDTQLKYIQPLVSKSTFTKNKIHVFVFWNHFMGRQSKRLIELVKQNSQLTNANNLEIHYINNDNFLAKALE